MKTEEGDELFRKVVESVAAESKQAAFFVDDSPAKVKTEAGETNSTSLALHADAGPIDIESD